MPATECVPISNTIMGFYLIFNKPSFLLINRTFKYYDKLFNDKEKNISYTCSN